VDRDKVEAELIVAKTITAIGEDINRDGLTDTPSRVVRSWSTLFRGYKQDPQDILKTCFHGVQCDQMIVLKDIEMFSTCEHHMLPFFGKAHVAYLPKHGRVVGLSKLARVVDAFARRLQIQERLTNEIAESIYNEILPYGVGVVVEAKHFCMISRGVSKQNSVMKTTALRGSFREPSVKSEFLNAIQ